MRKRCGFMHSWLAAYALVCMYLYNYVYLDCMYICDIEQTSDCTRLCTGSIVLHQCIMVCVACKVAHTLKWLMNFY